LGEKFGLGFTLLSDADHSTADAYGVWGEKEKDGRRWWGTERTTFVIGPDRVVREVFRRVDAREHDELVLSVLGGEPVSPTVARRRRDPHAPNAEGLSA
jgi:thioredoxin-dependent peroxiredoxin